MDREMKDLDKELITIIPKMNQLGITTFSSWSGCGLSHIFRRKGFIAFLNEKKSANMIYWLSRAIYWEGYKINIVKLQFLRQLVYLGKIFLSDDLSFFV
jgi:hypothetical protein